VTNTDFWDWVVCNLLFERPPMTKLLLLYGRTDTQKTVMCQMLSTVLYTYTPSTIFYDLIGAHNHYALWILDDFHLEEDLVKQGVEN